MDDFNCKTSKALFAALAAYNTGSDYNTWFFNPLTDEWRILQTDNSNPSFNISHKGEHGRRIAHVNGQMWFKANFNELINKFKNMKTKERAMLVAEKVHAGQSYDIYPYIYHVKQVVEIAEGLGYDESIVTACILHDVLEDGSLSYNDIKTNFGEEIAEIVYAVTDELGRNRKERKMKTYPKIRNNWKAVAVKICDRIANIRQSKDFNPKMLYTYLSEHEDFKKGLFNQDHPQDELEKAWFMLDANLKY